MATETRKGPLHADEGKEIRIACTECGRQTVHRVIRSAEYVSEYEEHQFSITSWDEYQIVECLGCQTHSFRHRHTDTENVDHDPDTGEAYLEEQVALFPNRETGRAEVEGLLFLPVPMQQIYRETLSALRNTSPVLAGIGIRAIVETVCKDRNASGKNLEQQIDSLVTQGVLTKDGAEILHSLRIMGNQAAHEVKPHTAAALNTALDVIDYVITGVYVLPRKASKLPQRGAA